MKMDLLKTSLDSLSVILFFILIIYLPDIDIQNALEKIGINNTFKLTIVLVLLLVLAMITYCYSKITGCVIFACTSLFLRTQFKYVEAYQEPVRLKRSTETTLKKLNLVSDNIILPKLDLPKFNTPKLSKNNNTKNTKNKELTVEEYLLKQISDDPNKTNLEKQIIKDITQKYFLNSDKLQKLSSFNEESEKYNIAAN